MTTRQRKSVEERFWSYVGPPTETGCWPWEGARIDGYRYGMFGVEGDRTVGAHRYSYSLVHGEIPAGLVVRHTCDNPGCVNPAHLVIGTYADNTQDAMGRGRLAAGERNGRAKLCAQEVCEIRAEAGQVSIHELARRYGVSRGVVRKIVRRELWRHVP